MSVQQKDVIDAIGIDKHSGAVVLTIIDHMEWIDKDWNHVFFLQEKLNTYFRFIESGEINESYPDSKDRDVVINLIFKHSPNEDAVKFIDEAISTAKISGLMIATKLLIENGDIVDLIVSNKT